MRNVARVVAICSFASLPFCLTGCWLVAAGAGVEAGYIAGQDDRSARETVEDQKITAAVKTKLLADSETPGLDINVDTFKSRVTLKGVLDSQRKVERALELARNTAGVRSVESKLVVR